MPKVKQSTAYPIAVLELLSVNYPAFSSSFRKCIAEIRHRAARTLDKDKRAILEAISEGFCSRQEISDRTKIPPVTVHVHLRQLIKEKHLVRRLAPPPNRPASGPGGTKPVYLYWPAGS